MGGGMSGPAGAGSAAGLPSMARTHREPGTQATQLSPEVGLPIWAQQLSELNAAAIGRAAGTPPGLWSGGVREDLSALPAMGRVHRDPGTQATILPPVEGVNTFNLQQEGILGSEAPRNAIRQQYPGTSEQDSYNQMMAIAGLSRAIPRGRG